jgi:hypothetical protein
MATEIDEFDAYDYGYRHGVFDKCNGEPRREFAASDDEIWIGGYNDGFDGNEVQIMKEVEPGEFSPAPEEHETFLSLWAEWDFGQDGMLFESEETGRAWMWNAMIAQYESEADMKEQMEFASVEELFDETGLAGFTIVTLIRD